MMKSTSVLLIFLIGMLGQNAVFAQSGEENSTKKPFFEPGECYEKCLLHDFYKKRVERFFVYIGDENKPTTEIETKTITINSETTKWIKIPIANTENDSMWHVVTMPKQIIERVVVKDPSKTDKYIIEEIEIEEFVEGDKRAEWRKIICRDNPSYADIVKKLQETLIAFNYNSITITGVLDENTKEVLSMLQTEYGLGTGALTCETLDFLKIDY